MRDFLSPALQSLLLRFIFAFAFYLLLILLSIKTDFRFCFILFSRLGKPLLPSEVESTKIEARVIKFIHVSLVQLKIKIIHSGFLYQICSNNRIISLHFSIFSFPSTPRSLKPGFPLRLNSRKQKYKAFYCFRVKLFRFSCFQPGYMFLASNSVFNLFSFSLISSYRFEGSFLCKQPIFPSF